MPRNSRINNKDYEPKRRNPITLGDDSNLEQDLKVIKVDSKNSILELSESELKVRGTIDASAITVDGASVQIGDDVGAITALNSATANELVTVGSTTTELDAEANLTFDGAHLSIAATGKILFDGGTHTYIAEAADDILDFYVGADKMLALDEANDKITLAATNWIAGTVSGATITEFSSPSSAYAGMILGYRMIGEDALHDTYTLTTSMVVPDSAMTVRFIAPPSGCVEVMVQVFFDGSANRVTTFGLSDNATYNSLGDSYQQTTGQVDESDTHVHQHYWTITGLTSGSTYNYWFGASANGGTLSWGGTGAGRYCDFIMKVTALPAATSDFAEYD